MNGFEMQPVPALLWEVPSEELPPLLLRPEQVARVLDVGRSTVFDLMRSGALRSVKVGGCRRVSATALRQYVTGLEAGDAA